MHHDIDLTKRGERYARRFETTSANINAFAPGGCPAGIEPRAWRRELEAHVEQHLNIVTGLLALLDDGLDADLEESGDEADAAWPEGRSHIGFTLDSEDDEIADEDGDELDRLEGDGLEHGEHDDGQYDDGNLIIAGGGSGAL